MRDDGTVRLASDDVGEGATTVNPKLPMTVIHLTSLYFVMHFYPEKTRNITAVALTVPDSHLKPSSHRAF